MSKVRTKFVIITGNPVDGFKFIGPFDNGPAAVDWANYVALEPDWWVGTVENEEDVLEKWKGDGV